ncbi:SlyX family protein [Aestuariibius sp. HNIBRBA575]|uniref:SlyX family protein n=1 Tax=Aestuariibius sp. HNIBRBA575 TaxID=3233343 RepID=UPI0034A1F22F
MTDLVRLEEQIAHLTQVTEDLSEVVARQDKELALLTRRMMLLMERAAEQDQDQGGTIPLADQRPPHW